MVSGCINQDEQPTLTSDLDNLQNSMARLLQMLEELTQYVEDVMVFIIYFTIICFCSCDSYFLHVNSFI